MELNPIRQSSGHQQITIANKEDVNDILRLNSQFHLDIRDFEWDQPDWIKEKINKGHYFVLKQENQVLGAIDIENINKEELYIETIAIDPDHHGSGLGKKLISFAKNKAQEMGCKKITVESFQDYKLLDFYKKVGFQLDDPPIGYHNGQPFHRFIMLL